MATGLPRPPLGSADAAATSLSALFLEIRERYIQLEGWLGRQPDGVPYGLAILPQVVVDRLAVEGMSPYYAIDDVEMRERARPILMRVHSQVVHTSVGDGVLVVMPLQ